MLESVASSRADETRLYVPQPLSHVGDVLLGNRDIHAEIQRDAGLVFNFFAAELGNRALEHLRVKVETERLHVTRLLAAEKIPRAAQFKVEGRDTKTGSQIRKLTNGC